MNTIKLNFNPEEVAEFLSGVHVSKIERNIDMSDVLERDNCREEARARREGV